MRPERKDNRENSRKHNIKEEIKNWRAFVTAEQLTPTFAKAAILEGDVDSSFSKTR